MTNRAPLIVAVVLLLLPVLYVGSYLALVVPESEWLFTVPEDVFSEPRRYRIGSTYAELCFWPVHRIDVQLRPTTWKWEHLTERRRQRRRLQSPQFPSP